MGLTFIAIAFLACAWGFLLLPDLRARGRSPGRSNSVKSFQDQLSGLDRTRPQGPAHRPGTTPRPGAAHRAPAGVRPRATGPTARTAASGPVARPAAPGARRTAPLAGRPGPRPVSRPPAGLTSMPRSRAAAAQRRVHALAALGGLAVLTLLAGLLVSSTLLLVHLVVDAGLAVYVYLLWSRAQARRATRAVPTVRSREDDDFGPLHRRASGS